MKSAGNGKADGFSACFAVINPSRYPGKARILTRYLERAGTSRIVDSITKEGFRDAVRSFIGSHERYLLVFGGDGTVHEALNVLMETGGSSEKLRGKAVGFVRGGSGNGYHDSYRMPVFPRRQLKTLQTSMARSLTVDVDLLAVGCGERLLFGQLAGLGFDAKVLARRKEQAKKGLLGYVTAFLYAFRALEDPSGAAQNAYTLLVTLGAGMGTRSFTVRSPMIEIGKRPYYGNRFRVCPGAVCDDGLMEVVLFNFKTRVSVLMHLLPLWMGRHGRMSGRPGADGRPLIERFKAERLEIVSDSAIQVHVDGELSSPKENVRSITVTVLPGAISFLVPRRFFEKRGIVHSTP